MTSPANPAPVPPRAKWFARPGVVLPVVGALILLVALVAPQATFGRTGDARASSYSTEPQGARLFYELTQRLGWDVEQRKVAALPADTNTIIAMLDPIVPMRASDAHELLERVRNGGALLYAFSRTGNAHVIADSLHVAVGLGHPRLHPAEDVSTCSPQQGARRYLNTIWPGDQVLLATLLWKGPRPDSVRGFAAVDQFANADRARSRNAAVGFPLGRGRIIVASDPDLFRNDALRVCAYGLDVVAVQMLEYLSENGATPRTRVAFDEYHQGFGEQHGSMDAIADYLVKASSGRLFFQLLVAGLVLLLAAAPRALAPHDPEIVERRSPLEHIDALGRAYAQVGATRSACLRLIRGVRRRVTGGSSAAGGGLSDDQFLDRAQRETPALAPDIALVRTALQRSVSRREFVSVGEALERIELSLTRI